MIKMVIFDLDGTLLNTINDLTDSTNYTLKRFGFAPKTQTEIKSYVGNGLQKLIEKVVPQGINNPCFNDFYEVFKNHYLTNASIHTKPYSQIIQMLEKLKKQKYYTVIISNKKDTIVKDLAKKYFGDLIDYSIGETPLFKKKPAPDMINYVLAKFNINKSECIYIGDSEVDIETCHNAQILGLFVTWGFRSKEDLINHQAKFLVNSPLEIIEYLKNDI